MSGVSKKLSSTKKSKNANKIASKLSQFFGFVFTGKDKVKKSRQENLEHWKEKFKWNFQKHGQ